MRSRRKPFSTILCLVATCFIGRQTGPGLAAAAATGSSSPPVSFRLSTAWPAAPLLLEILETISLERPKSFFELLDLLTLPEHGLTSLITTDEALYSAAFQIARENGFLSEPGSLGIAQRALALHVASPMVEAFHHFYADHTWPPPEQGWTEETCASWVWWYGRRICDAEKLKHIIGVETIDSTSASYNESSIDDQPQPTLLPFDHINPFPNTLLTAPKQTAILYANLSSPNFRQLHSFLYTSSSASPPLVQYVLRFTSNAPRLAHLPLTGYGTALDMKKTEYSAQDDRRRNNGAENETGDASTEENGDREPDLVETLLSALPVIEGKDSSATSLTENEILDLGQKATQFIMTSPSPLLTLRDLSQNFPKHMLPLSHKIDLSEEYEEEIRDNSAVIQPGLNLLWINGVLLQDVDVNPFGLLRVLRKERDTLSSLLSLGLNHTESIDALTHPSIAKAQSGTGGATESLFDASDREEGGNVVVWWNDLEADSRYESWTSSLNEFYRPAFPGQIHWVALNIHNVIFVVDLSTREGIGLGVQISQIIQRNYPVRFGFVPMVHTERAKQAARLFYYLIENYGRSRTLGLVESLLMQDEPIINMQLAKKLYDDLVANNLPDSEEPVLEFEDVISSEDDDVENSPIKAAREYAQRLGLTAVGIMDGAIGHSFVNGRYITLDDNMFRIMQYQLQKSQDAIQEALFSGAITVDEHPPMSTYFYDLPTTLKRRNMFIYPAESGPGRLQVYNLPVLAKETGVEFDKLDYVYPGKEDETPISLVLLADMDEKDNLVLFEKMVGGITNSKYRASYIHVPPSVKTTSYASAALYHLTSKKTFSASATNDLLGFLESLRTSQKPENGAGEVQHILTSAHPGLLTAEVKLAEVSASAEYLASLDAGYKLKKSLNLASDKTYLLVNGRLVGPVLSSAFVAEDFSSLADFEYLKRGQPAVEALTNSTLAGVTDRGVKANLISSVASIVGAAHMVDPADQGIFQRPQAPRNRIYKRFQTNLTSFSQGDADSAVFHIGALLDPLTETARKWASLLEWLAGLDGAYVQVHLHPAQTNKVPLKGFYRSNLQPGMKFTESGSEDPYILRFQNLPEEHLYTLAMDTPTAWLVRPNESIHDLDNIQLSHLSTAERAKGVEASFRLDYIVIEGHSRDSNDAPTAGLQLQLADARGQPVADTMVVANLGYLQLKAPHPGVFGLEIRDERGREVFEMESAGNQGFHSPSINETGNQISITSLEGLTIFPRFKKRPGMEGESVLLPSRSGSNADGTISRMFDKVSSLWKKPTNATEELVPSKKPAEINVFTVASGHLYERLSSIMILSVLRKTKSTVKFWFIENFLSPSFLEFIPHFAKEYGFEYELVTYKWPSWVRAQKEKQRIIWAYKILFLDVLFPMDLKRVIFVDADQIMRADLKELVDLDLKGAPYGYTPMGDDNRDMEGFRFWKTGYWKQFLAEDLKYHISALYVVDLERFRQTSAGDKLRAHYQALSADPESLSNLDQDLPNNLQREVPIYSLHEDWLWCETWCSMDRFEKAKSIDLCFNPLTKESKLVRARKTPGWIEYDNEIAQFTKKLVSQGLVHSELAAADTAVLAGNKPAAEEGEEVEKSTPSSEPTSQSSKPDVTGEPVHDEL